VEWATLAATYAKWIGRGVAFSLAALRQAFAAGRDLSRRDNVLVAAAACEMHPAAVIKGAELASTRRELERANERARADGVDQVPAIWVDGRLLAGERAIPA
jgi:2-hydroxychromene-2-carboxylate isomerase